MKIGNISFELQTVRLSRRTKLIKYFNIYLHRGIFIFDINYLANRYGNSFKDLIRMKIKDLSIFNLEDPDTIKILEYLSDINRKGMIKVQLSFKFYINDIYKNTKIKKLLKHRELHCIHFRQKYSIIDNERDGERLALSRFLDIYDKNLDRDILIYITNYNKLSNYYRGLNEYIIDHLDVHSVGLILSSVLSKYKNKNYLRI